ncbi:hypothetical protein HDU93_009787 [Gonapodya sp. JEL0774]|nr:hypothetical protein HDU93_009787 [Gonapodya sp. JEL0774]
MTPFVCPEGFSELYAPNEVVAECRSERTKFKSKDGLVDGFAWDVFSCGMVFFTAFEYLFSRHLPDGDSWSPKNRRRKSGKMIFLPEWNRFPALKELVGRMAHPNPARRPPILEIFSSPYISHLRSAMGIPSVTQTILEVPNPLFTSPRSLLGIFADRVLAKLANLIRFPIIDFTRQALLDASADDADTVKRRIQRTLFSFEMLAEHFLKRNVDTPLIGPASATAYVKPQLCTTVQSYLLEIFRAATVDYEDAEILSRHLGRRVKPHRHVITTWKRAHFHEDPTYVIIDKVVYFGKWLPTESLNPDFTAAKSALLAELVPPVQVSDFIFDVLNWRQHCKPLPSQLGGRGVPPQTNEDDSIPKSTHPVVDEITLCATGPDLEAVALEFGPQFALSEYEVKGLGYHSQHLARQETRETRKEIG